MNDIEMLKNKANNLPKKPGVYFYYDKNGKLIYIGKASVLKHRVTSYFVGAHDNKTEELVSHIANIKYRVTDSVIEALVLESNLIKQHQPKYNIREKDDKSFVQIVTANEDFPRVLAVRPTQQERINFKIKKTYGPYTNSGAVKEILIALRRLFTFRDCTDAKFSKYAKKNSPCLYYAIGLCPGPCAGLIDKDEYAKIIVKINDFLSGKSKRAIARLKKQMLTLSKQQQFELAAQIRDRINAFQHINDVAAIKDDRTLEQIKNIPNRIECYDISNLGKDFAVGSMVVFSGGEVSKNDYRRFKIENVKISAQGGSALCGKYQNDNIKFKKHAPRYMFHASCAGDPAMMASIIERRFNHPEWPTPDLIILDGGKGQLSATLQILNKKKIKVPVMAVAKGPTRKNFTLFKNAQAKKIVLDRKFIERVRDEAHRFAITYHRRLKNKSLTS